MHLHLVWKERLLLDHHRPCGLFFVHAFYFCPVELSALIQEEEGQKGDLQNGSTFKYV